MKKFSFHIYISLIGCVLFVCTVLLTCTYFFHGSASDTTQTDTLPTNELVLLWNCPADASLSAQFLSGFPDCSIIETFDNYMLISVPDSLLTTDTLARLRAFPGITAADPNYSLELSVTDSGTTVLPEYNTSINIEDFSATSSSNLSAGFNLYCNTMPANEVVIAIADTGVDIQHPLLSNFIWSNPEEIPGDNIDNDGNGYVDDINGWDFYHDDSSVCHYTYSADGFSYSPVAEDNDNHGTHVAGVIASVLRGGNLFNTGAPSVPVKIMPLKIHGGEKSSGSVASAIKAIKYAVMMDADVFNISWGSSATTASITTLEQTIRESDLLFVCASGNTGSDNDLTPVYPASFRMDNVISVSFVNAYGFLTAKSNYGISSVDIAAPGTDIYSTVVGNYAYMSGSSMAVPYVSGIAALLYSCYDNLYPATVRELLLSTAYLLPYSDTFPLPVSMNFAKDKLIVPGIPNLNQALIMAPQQLSFDDAAPVLEATTSYTEDFIRLTVSADDTDGCGIRTLRYAVGTKNPSAFRHGTAGTQIKDNTILFAKPGNYTLYTSDYAGNESVLHYLLSEDTDAPQITYTLHQSPSKDTYQLIAHFTEQTSELSSVYLLSGEYDSKTFPFTEATPLLARQGRINLRLPHPGYYTMYAADIRGNTTTTTLLVPQQDTETADQKEDAIDEFH